MKKAKKYVTVILGIAVLAIGLFLLKTMKNDNQALITLPYVCIGFGCGLFGHGMGNFIADKAIKNDPSLIKQMEIEKHDERNIKIANCAKSKAYDIMTFVYGALMVSFGLMNVDLVAILLLVFAYLFVQGCAIYYRIKYDKEM